MKYRLQDLIDIDHFQNLQDRLNQIYSFPSSIIDNDGRILTATAWQDVCTKFHRKNNECERECIKSDQYILDHLQETSPAVSYRCPHGLVDNATPIIIDGIHYGNFFTGQFFLEQPDLDFFRAQAKKYGFREEAYIEAVKKVPIWTQEQLNNYLFFIKGLIAVISESGLKRLKEIENRKQFEESEKRHRSILKTAIDGFIMTDSKGKIIEVNDAYCRMSGYSEDELLTMNFSYLEATEDPQRVALHIEKTVLHGTNRFESKHRRKDGSIFDVEISAQFRANEEGQFVSFIRDITERKLTHSKIIESEKRYRTLVESTNAVAWEFDLIQNRWTYIAPQAETVLGFAPCEWTDSDFWRNKIHPEDREQAIHFCSTMTAKGEDHLLEYRFFKKNGEMIWIRDIVGVESEDGQPKRQNGYMFDITDRMRVEESLRESEEKFSNLFNNAQVGMFRTKLDGSKILDMNDRFLEIFGRTREEIANTRSDLYWANPGQRQEMVRRLNKEGRVIDFECDMLSKSGEVRHCLTSLRLYPNQGILYGSIFDITDRKQAERALQESEERFRAIASYTPDHIFMQDKGLRYSFVLNPQLGLTEADMIGSTDGDLLEAADAEKLTAIKRRVLETGKPYHLATSLVNREGGTEYFDGHYIPKIDPSGQVDGLIGYFRNVTERKKAEDALKESEGKYRSMMEAMDESTYICSPDFHIEYMNPAMIKEFGRDATGELCYHAIHGLEKQCDWCNHQKIMQGETLKTELTKDDTGETFFVSNSPIYHTNGSISKLTTYRDITEQKKMEIRIQQAQKMESIGNLAGGIAHDFNNILFPIIGLSEMLIDDLRPGSPEHENAMEIYNAGIRGRDLVKQILAFSRQSDQKKMPIRVQQILKEAMKLSRSTIPANIQITQDIQSDCRLVQANPTQIHQIAINLITNAYHAVEPKSGEISVRLREVEIGIGQLPECNLSPGRYALLTVTDTGSGIVPTIMNKIFDPYFTTKEQGKGTGLGLAVIYGIVKDHHGDIKVTSEVGKGATFNVYLPIMAQTEKAPPVKGKQEVSAGHERILLVDDEEAIAKLEKQMLERLSYNVTMHVSSLEAFNAFKAKPNSFDLVISDMTMPNMTGDQLVKQLIAIRPDIPIIVCTGFSERLDKEKAESIGVKGFLMKPIGKAEMAKMVRKVLDESEGTAQG